MQVLIPYENSCGLMRLEIETFSDFKKVIGHTYTIYYVTSQLESQAVPCNQTR